MAAGVAQIDGGVVGGRQALEQARRDALRGRRARGRRRLAARGRRGGSAGHVPQHAAHLPLVLVHRVLPAQCTARTYEPLKHISRLFSKNSLIVIVT